jgi:hypothetical protein
MALRTVQAALARLFTDEATREAFIKDPQGSARAFGLNEEEAATFAQLAPQAIGRFARSLDGKRILDARKMTPLTAQALGAAFAEHFLVATANLAGDAGRVAEAWALAGRLGATDVADAPWIGDLARYEAAFVEAAHRRFGLRLLRFRFPIASIAGRLQAGLAVDDLEPRTTLAVWLRRPRGRLIFRAWSAPSGLFRGADIR